VLDKSNQWNLFQKIIQTAFSLLCGEEKSKISKTNIGVTNNDMKKKPQKPTSRFLPIYPLRIAKQM
jgi:hypothetical protein